jgi:hypothetical protein
MKAFQGRPPQLQRPDRCRGTFLSREARELKELEMKKAVSVFAALVILASSMIADAGTITSTNPNETFIIKVVHNNDKYIFNLCGAAVPDNCAALGRETGYTQAELVKATKKLKNSGRLRIAGAIGVGAGVAVALGAGVEFGLIPIGVVSLGTLAATSSNPIATSFGLIAWFGVHGAWTGVAAGALMHPMQKFKDARELNAAMADTDYKVASVGELAGDLAEGLATLN